MRSIADIFRDAAVLDESGRHVNGCDKMSNHSYGDAYERILPHRSEVTLMMEVGVADGSSLLAWRDIFPTALCVGLDIHPAQKIINEHIDERMREMTGHNVSLAIASRLEFHLGDQRSKEDCERAAGGRQFDFICEDATHQLDATLLTLLYLWPFVKPGGLYVVEEFANVGALRRNMVGLWPHAQIVDTVGPSGGIEPLVVLRKPL